MRLIANSVVLCLITATALFSPQRTRAEEQGKNQPSIRVAPFQGMMVPNSVGTVKLSGTEFEILTLVDYAGPVTWDVVTTDGTVGPVKDKHYFEAKPKSTIIGFRAGATEPRMYEAPDTPSLVIYPWTPSGRAIISAWGIEEMRPKKIAQIIVESNRAPQPPPIDPPVPDPKPKPPDPPVPDPTPKADTLWIIIVEESSVRTAETARVVNDLHYWNGLKAKGHEWRRYDPDSAESKDNGYTKRAESIGYPAVLLYDKKTGVFLKSFKLPLSTGTIDLEIKGVTR